MKKLGVYILLMFFSSCNSRTAKFNFKSYYKHNVSLNQLTGSNRNITRTFFYKGKALIFSLDSNSINSQRGVISLIDLISKKHIIDIKNEFFDYQNLILSMNDSYLYVTENGSKVLYEYNIAQKCINKIDISLAANAVIYGDLLCDESFLYFLNSPYGTTVLSKENIIYKGICSGVVMNSNYATISKPISSHLNLITGCLNKKTDSIEIMAIDEKGEEKWAKSFRYIDQLFNYFEIINTGEDFLIANDTVIQYLDKNGNSIWIYSEPNSILKCTIKDTCLLILSKKFANGSTILLKRINLKTREIIDSIELECNDSNSKIFELSVSNNYALIQNENYLYTILLSNFRNYSTRILKDYELMQTSRDNFSGNTYTIVDNCVYW